VALLPHTLHSSAAQGDSFTFIEAIISCDLHGTACIASRQCVMSSDGCCGRLAVPAV